MSQGFACLARTSQMEVVTAGRYHLEAAIAARHCSAASFEETNWGSICRFYDLLMEVAPSPLTQLNRAVAISYRDGVAAALPLAQGLLDEGKLPHSPALAAVLANLYRRAGDEEPARRFLNQALATASTSHQRRFIQLRAGVGRDELDRS